MNFLLLSFDTQRMMIINIDHSIFQKKCFFLEKLAILDSIVFIDLFFKRSIDLFFTILWTTPLFYWFTYFLKYRLEFEFFFCSLITRHSHHFSLFTINRFFFSFVFFFHLSFHIVVVFIESIHDEWIQWSVWANSPFFQLVYICLLLLLLLMFHHHHCNHQLNQSIFSLLFYVLCW